VRWLHRRRLRRDFVRSVDRNGGARIQVLPSSSTDAAVVSDRVSGLEARVLELEQFLAAESWPEPARTRIAAARFARAGDPDPRRVS
jgi:hypothetical protein